ncbi:MAG: ribosome rescue protein RqcH [Candidatus Thermoplasmatota archaeon]
MKKQMSSYDIAFFIAEAKSIVGNFIDKVWQEEDKIMIKIHDKNLCFIPGRWLYFSKEKIERKGLFAKFLKKRIVNGKVSDIKQVDFERIVEIGIEKKESYNLIFELFGDGNLVLLKNGIIEGCLRKGRWGKREIRQGLIYSYPKKRFNPLILSKEEFEKILNVSKVDIVRTLAVDTNLGGELAEEICFESDIEKNIKPKELSNSAKEKIYECIEKKMKNILPSYGIIYFNDSAITLLPYSSKLYSTKRCEKYQTLSEAIERFVFLTLGAGKKYEEEKERLERQILHQEEMIRKMDAEAKEAYYVADLLARNIDKYDKFLKNLLDAKKLFGSWEEVEGRIEQIAGEFSGKIKELNTLDGYIILDEQGTEIKLDLKKDAREIANEYYELGKKMKEKIKGAKLAIEEAKKESSIPIKKKKEEKKKIFWFEKYRWFISSDGNFVLCGKDAKTNEIVVKKHLKDKDRYVHADIHGAPSVVVKDKNGISERTLEESCIYAVSFSKAWVLKVGGVRAYWVESEQVSKRPPAGEFLPKGAFMIYGKKNYLEPKELKVGIGEIFIEDIKKVMCAPVQAIKTHCNRYIIISPGETKKTQFAKEVKKIFNVNIDEVMKILPPGDVSIVEMKI